MTEKQHLGGLTLPGYEHVGPFNKIGHATGDPLDDAARRHDIGYSKLEAQGDNPYFKFSDVDQQFLDETKDINTVAGVFSHSIFEVKKELNKIFGTTFLRAHILEQQLTAQHEEDEKHRR